MEILSIGNSFSRDAQYYLHGIARADKVTLNAFNLYIGGCPLSTHYRNMLSEERAYKLDANGVSTGFSVSIKEALLNRNWDVVTLQQASTHSPKYKSYQPYLDSLAEYVRKCVPKAKIAFHRTWAYQAESPRLTAAFGYETPAEMLRGIISASEKAAEDIRADLILPCGDVFMAMLEKGVKSVHRDMHHAHLGIGRYALGLTWYAVLTGRDVTENAFSDFDVPVSPEEIRIAKECVMEIAPNFHRK
ncbi:MAG: DUF4886 domain-containing protein [Ruminococcaceae bacterium]|nr:DUF4886 domain-containing protein [Oscillospiraceae bacterium]